MSGMRFWTGALLAGFVLHGSAAQSAPVTFKGKTINLVVGYGVGGGYDLWGRLVAKYVGKYLPGNPTVVVESMPGAGSLRAADYLYNVAPKDGTVVGVIGQTIPVDQLLNPKRRVHIQSAKFTWIGRMAAGVETIVVWNKSPVQSISDAKKQQATIAAVGPASGSAIYPTVLNNVIGTKFKVIPGYRGSKGMLMAMERGEVDGSGAVDVTTLTAGFPQFLAEKKIRVITQVSLKPDHYFLKAPTIVSLAKNDREKNVLALFAASGDIGRALTAPPNLSPKVTKIWRQAFWKTLHDPDLLSFAKSHNIEVSPLEGAALQRLVENVGETPKAVIQAAMKAMRSPEEGQ